MIALIFLDTNNTFIVGLLIIAITFFVLFGLRMLYNKRYKKPTLSIKLNMDKKWTREKHFRGEDHEDPHHDFNEIHVFFNIIWNFEISLLNESSVDGYAIKFLELKEFKGLEYSNSKIDKDFILKSNNKEVVPFSFNKRVRVIREDKDKYYTVFPEEFNDLRILIECKNNNNKVFYREYYFKGNRMKDCSLSEIDKDQWKYI